MTQADLPSLAHLAGEYGLKTAQGYKAAEELGLNLKRGAAKVKPWQEKLLRPELERMKRDKAERKHLWVVNPAPVAYKAAEDHTGFIEDGDEAGRLGFSNAEWTRQLKPILKKLRDEAN